MVTVCVARDTPCFGAHGDCAPAQVVFLIAAIFVLWEASEELDSDEDLDAKYMVTPLESSSN